MKRRCALTALLFLMAPGALAQGTAADCPDLTSSLRQVREGLDGVRLQEATSAGAEAEASLSCQTEVVNTLGLSSLFQLLGSCHLYLGDMAQAEVYFGRAVAVSPAGGIDPSLGAQVASIYEDVRSRVLSVATGSFQGQAGLQAWVDGRALPGGLPLDVASGLHLLQQRLPDGSQVNHLVRVAPGQQYRLDSAGGAPRLGGLAQTPAPAEVPAPVPTAPPPAQDPVSSSPAPAEPRQVPWGWLAGGAGAMAAGGLVMGLAAASHSSFDSTADIDELDGLRARTNVLGALGIGLEVVGLGLVGTGLALTEGGVGLQAGWTW